MFILELWLDFDSCLIVEFSILEMLICLVRLLSLVFSDVVGWYGDEDVLRMFLIGFDVVLVVRGDDLVSFFFFWYWGVFLYFVWVDYLIFFCSWLEFGFDFVVVGEIKEWMFGGVCKFWCLVKDCWIVGLIGVDEIWDEVFLGGVGGFVGRDVSVVWFVCFVEVVIVMIVL